MASPFFHWFYVNGWGALDRKCTFFMRKQEVVEGLDRPIGVMPMFYLTHQEGFRCIHRAEEDRLLPSRSFFDGDGKKLLPLHGMKVGGVHYGLSDDGGTKSQEKTK
jgi:hypothetical protein